MPCATIHLALAGRALREWESAPSTAPFRIAPHTVDAFLHGSMGPDLGFVPGTDRFLSVLAHYVEPAGLLRELARGARDEREAAYAWGWAAHLVGDVVLHPRVGHACGEVVRGDPSVRLNALEDVETHVSVEVGLDILTLRADPDIPRPPTRPLFDARTVGFLTDAFRRAYGIPLEERIVLESHRTATVRTARWPWALQVLDRARGLSRGRPQLAVRGLVGLARQFTRTGSALRGFLAPRRPPAWLVTEATEEAARFPDRMRVLIDTGLESLENRNLESGEPNGRDDPHPESVAAYRRLDASRVSGRPS
ncbi:MAG: zinc dependent phospholipase C family protein [Gemmatimonadota bacterium]